MHKQGPDHAEELMPCQMLTVIYLDTIGLASVSSFGGTK